jgi:hypothetical protein
MALAADSVLDGLLDVIATATRVSACTSQPANFAGIAAVSVGNYTLTGGSYTKANGDVSGRKITLGAQSGNNGTATGAANYLAYDNGSTLLFVTAASGQTVNSGSPWTIGSYKVCEVADPT